MCTCVYIYIYIYVYTYIQLDCYIYIYIYIYYTILCYTSPMRTSVTGCDRCLECHVHDVGFPRVCYCVDSGLCLIVL